MPERHQDNQQISLEIEPHPALLERIRDDLPTWMVAHLEAKIEVTLTKDYNAGDRFRLQVIGPDGELIRTVDVEVEYVVPKPIYQKSVGLIGYDRIHKAKPVEESA